jgi:hypothetical protein
LDRIPQVLVHFWYLPLGMGTDVLEHSSTLERKTVSASSSAWTNVAPVFETMRDSDSLSNSKGGDFMKAFRKARIILGALGLAMVMGQVSSAQALNSNVATVALNAVLAESLTVAAGPATVNFTPLAPNGITLGSAAVAITTTWALAKGGAGGRTGLKVYAGFTSATALTDGAGDNIPTANVLGQVGGVGAFAPFTGASGPIASNNALTVFTLALGAAGTFNSSNVTSLALEINTAGLALPANTYTGTLTIQAQAI